MHSMFPEHEGASCAISLCGYSGSGIIEPPKAVALPGQDKVSPEALEGTAYPAAARGG